MAGAEDKQTGTKSEQPSQKYLSTVKSRSPSPSSIRWSPKMPKYKSPNRKQNSGPNVSGGEEDGMDSTVKSHLGGNQMENEVFSPVKTDIVKEETTKVTNGTSAVIETESKVIKKRLSSLFKPGKNPIFRRQDSDPGYGSQSSPISPTTTQNPLQNAAESQGYRSSPIITRELSYEEELQYRLAQVRCCSSIVSNFFIRST